MVKLSSCLFMCNIDVCIFDKSLRFYVYVKFVSSFQRENKWFRDVETQTNTRPHNVNPSDLSWYFCFALVRIVRVIGCLFKYASLQLALHKKSTFFLSVRVFSSPNMFSYSKIRKKIFFFCICQIYDSVGQQFFVASCKLTLTLRQTNRLFVADTCCCQRIVRPTLW